MPSFDLDIGVIYTYERPFMPRLLDSLAHSGDGLATRLILIDNASIDGAEQWRPYFPETQIVRNPRRLHYAANLNRILAASTSRHTLLLNTDMYFDPAEQCLAKMVEFMERQPRCGLSGCRLLHADGDHAPSARRFQTVPIILARRLGLGGLLGGTIRDYLYAHRAGDESFECDWLSGCFLMLRRAAARNVGPFDEKFVKYFEDVDICLRMARAGWKVMYHGATYCHHLEQRGSKRLFSADARRHLRSYLRWLLKWGFAPQRRAA
jgi:GT2 family glycosyltransferase